MQLFDGLLFGLGMGLISTGIMNLAADHTLAVYIVGAFFTFLGGNRAYIKYIL